MWIIKLGGSLLGSSELMHWLDAAAQHGDGKIVIVPGGGPFADAVREAQQLSGVDDLTAHQLAVMAMDQYGVLMTGLKPALATASSELEIAERSWQHRGIVWLPSHMVCADESIPPSWNVTSDSLAAWLAHKLNADHLILVKSREASPDENTFASAVASGLIDASLPEFALNGAFKTWMVHKADFDIIRAGLPLDGLDKAAICLI